MRGRDLGLWSRLRPVVLPSPGALPASYSLRSVVPLPAADNMEPVWEVNGTVHLRHVGPDADVFGLGLPLYSFKHEVESVSEDEAERFAVVVVPPPEVARFIWRKYGINLVALGSLEAAGANVLYFPDEYSGPIEAFAYFRVTGRGMPQSAQLALTAR